VDVCRPGDLDDLAVLASARGRLLGWVNAAAVTGPVGTSRHIGAGAWQQTVSVNLIGSAMACAAALRFAGPGAAILNISGGGATSPRPYVAAYAASKAALVRHTETLAAELDGSGIRVNALAPGAFASDLWTSDLQVAEGPAPAADASAAVLRRAAACAAWLLRDDSWPLSGKLIAAQWDPWDSWRQQDLTALQHGEQLTLRRQASDARA
jgi:NAD(P)-dependent dehydrogenase (short-subunit alcohol dehydrogenase family)